MLNATYRNNSAVSVPIRSTVVVNGVTMATSTFTIPGNTDMPVGAVYTITPSDIARRHVTILFFITPTTPCAQVITTFVMPFIPVIPTVGASEDR